jgi:ubiquinol-cytochrome c reductase cytochrome c1 subunit
MPRTGVTAESAEKVIEYLKTAGDPKAEERNEVGKSVMIYLVIFTIFAYLWKRQVWRDLH